MMELTSLDHLLIMTPLDDTHYPDFGTLLQILERGFFCGIQSNKKSPAGARD